MAAPNDHISEEDITVLDDRVIIRVSNPQWARFAPTGSMKPIFDQNSNAIEVVPKDPAEIREGDIISYSVDGMDNSVIHRVVSTGYDGNGWYAVVKGDSNTTADNAVVRWTQVRRLVVAIIY
jgi:signal peptidase I